MIDGKISNVMITELLYSHILRSCLQGERVTLARGLPLRVYKAARVTREGGLLNLSVKVTLAGGLTFPLVNTPPGRVR